MQIFDKSFISKPEVTVVRKNSRNDDDDDGELLRGTRLKSSFTEILMYRVSTKSGAK